VQGVIYSAHHVHQEITMFDGELVTLGPIQRDYLPRYVEWLNDWEVRRFLAPTLPHPYTIQDEEDWFNHQRNDQSSKIFAILTCAEGKLIGNCGLHQIDWSNRNAILGIFIGDKDFWGRGFGTDTTRTLLRYAFEEANLHRIELEVFSFNQRAIRVYEKVGFKLEGTRRQALYREGAWHDEHIMAILHDEWLALNKKS
jgi:RimJ/RimL family protein N-acetyltransferase